MKQKQNLEKLKFLKYVHKENDFDGINITFEPRIIIMNEFMADKTQH